MSETPNAKPAAKAGQAELYYIALCVVLVALIAIAGAIFLSRLPAELGGNAAPVSEESNP